MRGLIIVNAYTRSTTNLNQSIRLREELSGMGVDIDIKTNDFFGAIISDGNIASKCDDYDFCIYLDKDKYISSMLELNGLRLFNSHRATRLCDDKMATIIALANHDIPMPNTMSGLLCYDQSVFIKDVVLDNIIKELSLPLIIKSCYGSLGEGVYKVNNIEEMRSIATRLIYTPHLFQQYIDSSYGRDIRVIVIGNQVVACMLRENKSDFRSNIELGGIGSPYHIDDETAKLCIKVSQILGLDYCGIDLLIGNSGETLVCEVNSNAFFGGIEKICNINIAKIYAEYIVDLTKKVSN